MKYTAALGLALTAAAWAKPTGTAARASANASAAAAGSAQDVTASITKWLADIQAVNTFVDTAGSLTDAQQISSAASTAFVAAQDEGTQNTALQKLVTLDASGQAAAQDLLNQFNIIGPAINDTISNPQNLQKNLAAINGARYVTLFSLSFSLVPSSVTSPHNTNTWTSGARLQPAMVPFSRRVPCSSRPPASRVSRPLSLSCPTPAPPSPRPSSLVVLLALQEALQKALQPEVLARSRRREIE